MEDFEKQKKELDEIFDSIDKKIDSLEKKSYDGTRDILKYFDRINDKLFNFNNIMIAGFFAISKIKDGIPMEFILVPIFNLAIIILIEYKMMEKSRMEANILEENFNSEKYNKSISNSNKYSLYIIFTTTVVTLFFLYNLLK